jgi:filamentous hemagglutinin family protein
MKHSVHKLLRWSWKIVMTGLVLPFSAPTKAEVTLDGTLGPAGSLAGPHFVIPDTVGQTVGTNLFHSFGLFNINTSESATFTGPAAIDNVISRVTGGSQSFIDGPLRSEIQSANLWFINPAGVLFGQHASLDIQGSFHVSTADYLKLGDGGRFDATHPEDSVLTTAPPEAFGFLGERQPAGIAVQGSFLKVPDGETLSVVGGDIRIADGTLYALGGRIDMVSAASPGEALPNAPDLGVASFERLGKIEVSYSSSERPVIDGNEIGNVDASGEGGGRIFIRGGEFVADNAFVFADTRGGGQGQRIDIGVTGQITMRNGALITADTLGSGSGGDVTVEAGSLEIRNGAVISTSTFSSGHGGDVQMEADHVLLSGGSAIDAETVGSGDAGTITVKAGDFQMRNGAGIFASTLGSGHGGDIRVEADHVLLSGDRSLFFTGIRSETVGSGDAGTITVKAGDLEISNGAVIITPTVGSSHGGDIRVEADHMLLSGHGPRHGSVIPRSVIDAETFGSGDAGTITVKAGDLEIRNGALIITSVSSSGSGRGGDVRVEANRVLLSGDRSLFFTGIIAETRGNGHAGDISIKAGDLELTNDAEIVSGSGRLFPGDILVVGQGHAGTIDINADNITLFDSRISTSTLGSGPGGNITIEATDIELNRDASIFAGSFGTGPAGQIFIKALDSIRLVNDSQISVATTQADVGSITLEVGDFLYLRNGSSITTSAAGGTGNGGNITIGNLIAPTFVVLDGSQIVAKGPRAPRR